MAKDVTLYLEDIRRAIGNIELFMESRPRMFSAFMATTAYALT